VFRSKPMFVLVSLFRYISLAQVLQGLKMWRTKMVWLKKKKNIPNYSIYERNAIYKYIVGNDILASIP
jgi:hypothetical protein